MNKINEVGQTPMKIISDERCMQEIMEVIGMQESGCAKARGREEESGRQRKVENK